MPPQSAGGHNIDSRAKQLGQFILKPGESEQAHPSWKVDEKIDVRVGTICSTRNAAENSNVSDAVGVSEGEYSAAIPRQPPTQIRCSVEAQQAGDLGLAPADSRGDLPL